MPTTHQQSMEVSHSCTARRPATTVAGGNGSSGRVKGRGKVAVNKVGVGLGAWARGTV